MPLKSDVGVLRYTVEPGRTISPARACSCGSQLLLTPLRNYTHSPTGSEQRADGSNLEESSGRSGQHCGEDHQIDYFKAHGQLAVNDTVVMQRCARTILQFSAVCHDAPTRSSQVGYPSAFTEVLVCKCVGLATPYYPQLQFSCKKPAVRRNWQRRRNRSQPFFSRLHGVRLLLCSLLSIPIC